MGKTKVKESKKPLTLSKVVVYILLILLAITIIIPVGWVFVASVKQNSEFTEVRGYFRRRFISRTLSMRGRRRAWELTCSTQ